MKKANGPKNKNKKNLITHLMTMPQAAGKKDQLELLNFSSETMSYIKEH